MRHWLHQSQISKYIWTQYNRLFTIWSTQLMGYVSYQLSLHMQTVAHVTQISFKKCTCSSRQKCLLFCSSLPCLLSILSLSVSDHWHNLQLWSRSSLLPPERDEVRQENCLPHLALLSVLVTRSPCMAVRKEMLLHCASLSCIWTGNVKMQQFLMEKQSKLLPIKWKISSNH